MPLPVAYGVQLRGEAKRWKQGVGVGEVSRLVARLGRGEYGIFVTTSYYTRQAQEEVFEDAYPVKLFAGIGLVLFLRELKLVRNGQIKEEWLAALSEDPSSDSLPRQSIMQAPPRDNKRPKRIAELNAPAEG